LGSKGKETAWYLGTVKDIRIERVIVVGAPKTFAGKTVKVLQGGKDWETSVETIGAKSGKAGSIIIRDPKVSISQDFEIYF